MGMRSILVVILGLGVAGGSVYLARDYVDSSRATAAVDKHPELASVVVAARDIGFGQPIDRSMLTTIDWPRSALPPGAVTSMAAMLPASGEPPRRAKRAMAQGELLLSSKVSAFGEKVTLVQTLGPNQRAMAIKVDAATAVGGFVTPGDRVDVLLTQGRANTNDLRTVTILQNVRVLGVDQNANEAKDQPEVARTVTVEVTPEQGQTLALAQRAGSLSLSLRTLTDAIDKPLDSIKLSDVLRDKSPEPTAPAKKPTITVRRANKVSTVEVNE